MLINGNKYRYLSLGSWQEVLWFVNVTWVFKHISETGSISVIIRYKERKVLTLGQGIEIDSISQNLYPSTPDNGHRSSFWKVVFEKCQDNGLWPKQQLCLWLHSTVTNIQNCLCSIINSWKVGIVRRNSTTWALNNAFYQTFFLLPMQQQINFIYSVLLSYNKIPILHIVHYTCRRSRQHCNTCGLIWFS